MRNKHHTIYWVDSDSIWGTDNLSGRKDNLYWEKTISMGGTYTIYSILGYRQSIWGDKHSIWGDTFYEVTYITKVVMAIIRVGTGVVLEGHEDYHHYTS